MRRKCALYAARSVSSAKTKNKKTYIYPMPLAVSMVGVGSNKRNLLHSNTESYDSK